jgi:hypothetical protein
MLRYQRYLSWGQTPVLIGPFDPQFIRCFSAEYVPPRQIVDQHGVTLFSPIEILTQPEYEKLHEWHAKQARDAIDAVIKAHPYALDILPPKPFRVRIERRWTHFEGKEYSLCAITVEEIVPKEEVRKRSRTAYTPDILHYWSHEPIDHLGKEYNPFYDLSEKIVQGFPAAWKRWLKIRLKVQGNLRWINSGLNGDNK